MESKQPRPNFAISETFFYNLPDIGIELVSDSSPDFLLTILYLTTLVIYTSSRTPEWCGDDATRHIAFDYTVEAREHRAAWITPICVWSLVTAISPKTSKNIIPANLSHNLHLIAYAWVMRRCCHTSYSFRLYRRSEGTQSCMDHTLLCLKFGGYNVTENKLKHHSSKSFA